MQYVPHAPVAQARHHQLAHEPHRPTRLYQAPPHYVEARPASPRYRFVEFLPDGRQRPVYLPASQAGGHYEEPTEYIYMRTGAREYASYGDEDDYP